MESSKGLGIAVNFSKAFSALKIITILAVILLFISNAIWAYFYQDMTTRASQKVYVVSDHGTTSAVESPTSTPTVYEARNHVKEFMQLMFANDADTYKDRIDLGLKLIEKQDGLAIYQSFRESKLLERYNRFNMHTELTIDSIKVDVSAEPYIGYVYARQRAVFPDETQSRPLAAKFELKTTYRSDDNPFGLLIQHFNFIEYNPKKED